MAIVAILTLPLRGLVWLVKHPKAIILIAILVFVFMGIRACQNVLNPKPTTAGVEVQPYQEKAPPLKDAPFVVVTTSRVYYVSQYTDDKQVVTLSKYYIWDKKKWKLSTVPLLIDRKYYGEVKVYARQT